MSEKEEQNTKKKKYGTHALFDWESHEQEHRYVSVGDTKLEVHRKAVDSSEPNAINYQIPWSSLGFKRGLKRFVSSSSREELIIFYIPTMHKKGFRREDNLQTQILNIFRQ